MKYLIMGLFSVLYLSVASGCTAFRELNDPWLRAERIDFSKKAAVFGVKQAEAFSDEKWKVRASIRHFGKSKRYPMSQDSEAFFEMVPPGKYYVHITRVFWVNQGAYTVQGQQVIVDYSSEPFEVKAGDAVYLGDITVNLGQPYKIDQGVKDSLKTLASFATSAYGIKVSIDVSDDAASKRAQLEERYVGDDYTFRSELVNLRHVNKMTETLLST